MGLNSIPSFITIAMKVILLADGEFSEESKIQEEREKSTLSVVYFSAEEVPSTPFEAPLEEDIQPLREIPIYTKSLQKVRRYIVLSFLLPFLSFPSFFTSSNSAPVVT